MPHPYERLPGRQYWKTGVETGDASSGIASPKRLLTFSDKIGTAGSCFAQHIARNLRNRGFKFIDVEPAPQFLPSHLRNQFGYELYSARYGNVYTSTQLFQLIIRATGKFTPKESYWKRGDRFFDPFRPSVEPEGFASLEELETDRAAHLRAVAGLFRKIDVFVFTLGLTETWRSKDDGAVYPSAPGVRGIGEYDPGKYDFVNLSYNDIHKDLTHSFSYLRRLNPNLRIILTVSPVPLAATATHQHVLTATTYSKAVLRSVAGSLAEQYDYIDYFPSYELITSPVFSQNTYEPDWREVRPEAVSRVMQTFFKSFVDETSIPQAVKPALVKKDKEDVICEDAILSEYAKHV